MLIEAGQVAQEAARAGSSLTGSFILDGATLIAALKIVEAIAAKVRGGRNGNGKKPGEGKACEEHGKAIDRLRGDVIKLQANEQNRDKAFDLLREENRQEHQQILAEIKASKLGGRQ